MKVLVTGGTGMVGRELVKLLLDRGNQVRVVSMDEQGIEGTEHLKLDLTKYANCMTACSGMSEVYNLIGIKGSPKVAEERPDDFFTPQVLANLNMLKAARVRTVRKYLYVSSYGTYSPSPKSREQDLWNRNPSDHDWFGGWAKRIGEIQVAAMQKQYGMHISIVRPANVYGDYDSFGEGAMVIPSLIKKALEQDVMEVWGDGSAVRDFIHAKDVATAMLLAIETPGIYNIGSGSGYSIKEIVDMITSFIPRKVVWDETKPTGDKIRVLDIKRINNLGWKQSITLKEGIGKTIDWYRENKDKFKRYNIFK